MTGPTGPTATYPRYVTISIAGTAASYGETIASTGTYTTTFNLGFGPSMTPNESLLIQGVSVDTGLRASLQGFTGYTNGGLYKIDAAYLVLGRQGKGTFPYVANQYCYYGTYNFSTE
jgi:hypothetical protein